VATRFSLVRGGRGSRPCFFQASCIHGLAGHYSGWLGDDPDPPRSIRAGREDEEQVGNVWAEFNLARTVGDRVPNTSS
jgi:hypothetical protein